MATNNKLYLTAGRLSSWHYEAALAHVRLYRELAQSRPEAFTGDLAGALNNLAAILSAVGRSEEALACAQEAFGIYRELARSRPEAFTPDLAGSLNNLAAMLSELGRREQALTCAMEALALHRELALSRSEAFAPDLAMSLNNLGNRLSTLGRREEALTYAMEALALYRELAQSRPEAFTPSLAVSLNNLAAMLSELGRRDEALTCSMEAVGLRRELAQSGPEAFTPDLASSLNNLAAILSAAGRPEEALRYAQEAAGLRRQLARERPEAFTPDLAGSLNNLAAMLSKLGRHEEALACAMEAVGLRRKLAESQPEAFTPDLAGSLNNFAAMLSAVGRREEALSCAQEACGLYHELAQSRPEAFTPDLAGSLNNLSAMLSAVGRREEALTCAQEASGLYRELTQSRPDVFTPNLAVSLDNLVSLLQDKVDSASARPSHEQSLHRSASPVDSTENLPLPPEIPKQGHGPHFEISDHGIIAFAMPDALDRYGNNVERLKRLHPLLLNLSSELSKMLDVGNLPHWHLKDRADAYRSLVDRDLESIDFSLLYVEGLHLSNTLHTLQSDMEMPPLPLQIREAVETLLQVHGVFMLATAEGLEAIAAEERYRRTSWQEIEYRTAAIDFARSLQNEPTIIDPMVASFVLDTVEEITKGTNPERSGTVASGTLKNVAITAATAATLGAFCAAAAASGSAAVIVSAGATVLVVGEALKKSKPFATVAALVAKGLDNVSEAEGAKALRTLSESLKPQLRFLLASEPQLRRLAGQRVEFKWLHRSLDWLKQREPDGS